MAKDLKKSLLTKVETDGQRVSEVPKDIVSNRNQELRLFLMKNFFNRIVLFFTIFSLFYIFKRNLIKANFWVIKFANVLRCDSGVELSTHLYRCGMCKI